MRWLQRDGRQDDDDVNVVFAADWRSMKPWRVRQVLSVVLGLPVHIPTPHLRGFPPLREKGARVGWCALQTGPALTHS